MNLTLSTINFELVNPQLYRNECIGPDLSPVLTDPGYVKGGVYFIFNTANAREEFISTYAAKIFPKNLYRYEPEEEYPLENETHLIVTSKEEGSELSQIKQIKTALKMLKEALKEEKENNFASKLQEKNGDPRFFKED